MNDDRSERRSYRKSPGRQYGYDYDPLHGGRNELGPFTGTLPPGRSSGTSPRSEPLIGKDTGNIGPSRSSGTLAPRPDPRRTRQLLRQQIIATKSKTGMAEDTGQMDPEIRTDLGDWEPEDEDLTLQKRWTPIMGEDAINRVPTGAQRAAARGYDNGRRQVYPVQARRPARIEDDPSGQHMPFEDELDLLDADISNDEEADPLTGRVDLARSPIAQRDYTAMPRQTSVRSGRRGVAPEDDIAREEEGGKGGREEKDKQQGKQGQRGKKKGILSRRKLIVGALVVGGGAVAAYELIPKIPQALENAGANIEHQLQDAFNRGVAAGGEAVRKELINGLDTLEGVSLEGAIGAAKLTRVAYDVFVSPIVTLASTIADDFLLALLNALITARHWLAQINADNATLLALTNVLQNWVNQVHNMPKKLQTITETDLDGAQAYLRALQRTIQQQQAILNGQVTPTPNASATPHTSPTPGASTTPGTTTTPSH